jgi:hypothetical protein
MGEEIIKRENDKKIIIKELNNLLDEIGRSNLSDRAKKMSTAAVSYCLCGVKQNSFGEQK